MCDEDEILFLLQDEQKQSRKRIRDCRDPFESLNCKDFLKRYRLTKPLARDLVEELRPMMSVPLKATDLSVETKVLTALSFYATGSYQRPIGDISGHSVAQQTVSSALGQVTKALNHPIMRTKYIHFPSTLQERNVKKQRFYQQFHIPGVLGCIDGTHVAILRPASYEERYYCRKQYHSLNVQIICDADMYIMCVDASFGGACHDAHIWASHPIKTHLQNLSDTEATWLLGDSGYPLRAYLMTPVLNTELDTPEAHYTSLHVRTRNIVERTIGLLKARFRCLLAHRVLHYNPYTAGLIVNACVILHNICIKSNLSVDELTLEELELEQHRSHIEPIHRTTAGSGDLLRGTEVRLGLISHLWQERRNT